MIIGERVRLRAVERDDLPRFVHWLNDPEVTAGLTLVTPLSLAQEEKWFERVLAGPPENAPMVIEINTPRGWESVGNLGLHSVNWRDREAELGIFIGEKAFWNQGYGEEVICLLLDYAFWQLNLHRVFLRVHADNPRAVRCYEKVGFVHEGRMRQACYNKGEYVDVLVMGVLRSEWKEKGQKKAL